MPAVILRRQGLGRGSINGITSFSTTGIIGVRNDEEWPDSADLAFRWGTTSTIPTRNVVNLSSAIHTVSDKIGFRRILQQNETKIAPTTWFSLEEALEARTGPVVVRRSPHHQGRWLWVADTDEALRDAVRLSGPSMYISELINKVAEYRVAFVSGRVCWVANKTPGDPSSVAWNVAQGGRFDNVRWGEWPLRVVRVAREAFMLSGLDFGGVDVMTDADGQAYVLEINSAPSQTSPYRQECMAKCFDYIVTNGKGDLPITTERGGFRKFIHPALTNEAIMV